MKLRTLCRAKRFPPFVLFCPIRGEPVHGPRVRPPAVVKGCRLDLQVAIMRRPRISLEALPAIMWVDAAVPRPVIMRRRAYEIYLERGGQPGHELDDWLQAERELSIHVVT